MKFIARLTGLFVLVSVNLLTISKLSAQTPASTPDAGTAPPGVYATVTYSSGQSVVAPGAGGIFSLVGLQPGDVVQVVVQYPTSKAMQVVNLEALDGGIVLPPKMTRGTRRTPFSRVIGADGTLSFAFQAGSDPGLNQVSLRQGAKSLGLQFYVLDAQNPQNNPSAITPATPGS